MKYYTTYAATYHNGKLIGIQNGGYCLTEEELPREEVYTITWENLSQMYQNLHLWCDFNIWNFKKGRRVSFFHSKLFDKNTWDIKEWKEKELNIEVRVYHTERKASIEDLKYFDATKVKKYLDERVDK
jgi:hypothetical protein